MKLKELFEDTLQKLIITEGHLKDGYLRHNYYDDVVIDDVRIKDHCKIKSFKGLPKIIQGNLQADYLDELESLVGAPEEVKNVFMYDCPKITSLEGIGKEYFQKINGAFYITDSIRSHVLGLLKIQNLTGIQFDDIHEVDKLTEVQSIINKHLKAGRNINKCKSELKDAGLEEYAQL